MAKRLFLILFLLASAGLLVTPTDAQVVVDRIVATVSDGVKTELITHSDLLWQLALQPDVPISNPSESDLKRALQLQIDQRIFALEAQRLPRTAPTEKEIADKIADVLSHFPSAADFERRLKTVGFDSVKDDNFENIIAQRVAIEKYIDFRFRSFVVITTDDEAKYYRDVWAPDHRRRNPNIIVPPLEEVRTEVDRELTENRVAVGIQQFLDEAKRRVEVATIGQIL